MATLDILSLVSSFSHEELGSVRNPEKQLKKIGKEVHYPSSKTGCEKISIFAVLVWLVASPVLYSAAFFARCCGYYSLSKKWTVLSLHLSYNTHLIENIDLPKQFRNKLLVSARNIHKLGASHVFCRPGCYSPDGVCFGMSLHFLHLALKTVHLFHESDAHLQAVTRRFRKGAPLQSTYLQALCDVLGKETVFETISSEMQLEKKMFLSTENRIAHYPAESAEAREARCAQEKKRSTDCALMPPGAYYVNAALGERISHALVYIKQGANLSYLFDPNIGTLRFQGEKSGQEVQEFFSRYYRSTCVFMRKAILCTQNERNCE